MTFCFSGSWGRLSILTYICFNRVESSELKVYPSLKGNTRCCYFCYFSCKPFNWHWWSFEFLFLCTIRTVMNRCSHGFSQKHTMAMRQCMSPNTLETLVGQGDHPRDWAALQMSKNNLVAFSQSIKSREDHFVNVTRQYQVTVAFLLKIKLWRGITWECHDIHGVLPTQLLSSWVPSAPLVPWGSWWDAVDPKLMLNVSLLWNLQGIMMD